MDNFTLKTFVIRSMVTKKMVPYFNFTKIMDLTLEKEISL